MEQPATTGRASRVDRGVGSAPETPTLRIVSSISEGIAGYPSGIWAGVNARHSHSSS